ncbi:MAG: hypothetical protein DYH08_07045 [Actinobacteria bacterium ATB1]|nr:hypothetical protein [Actinobacteria bacterium ATB1]
MVRTFLVAQTLILLAVVFLVLGAVVTRKLLGDRRAERHHRARLQVRDGVFAFVASDGQDVDAIVSLVPEAPGREREFRTAHICRELMRLTSGLKGDVKARSTELMRQLGWTEYVTRHLERSHDSGERAWAASVLGDLRSDAPPLALVRALRDEDEAVRICATRSLGKYNDTIAAPALIAAAREGRVAPGIVAEALVALGPEIESLLTFATADESPLVRKLAIDVVGALRLPGARRHVLALLSDSDRPVRIAAARALGRIGWPDVAPELSVHCIGSEQLLRLAAVESTVELEAPEGIPVLAAAMSDPDHLVAHRAAQGLARLANLAGGRRPIARAAYGVLCAIAELDIRAGAYAREALAVIHEEAKAS